MQAKKWKNAQQLAGIVKLAKPLVVPTSDGSNQVKNQFLVLEKSFFLRLLTTKTPQLKNKPI
jgi:hypothetical protein